MAVNPYLFFASFCFFRLTLAPNSTILESDFGEFLGVVDIATIDDNPCNLLRRVLIYHRLDRVHLLLNFFEIIEKVFFYRRKL